jgi:hypothetical protein
MWTAVLGRRPSYLPAFRYGLPGCFLPASGPLQMGGSSGSSSKGSPAVPTAEVDMLSVVMLWMDYSQLTDKLAKAAEDDGDITTAWELSKIDMAYGDAAYQAGRMRVDQVTLDVISKPVSEIYIRHNRMELETMTVRPDGLRMLREFNKATVAARTKQSATKAAAIPTSMSDGDQVLPRRQRSLWLLLRGRSRTSRDVHRPSGSSKQPHVPQAPPPKRQAAGNRPGPLIPSTKRPITVWMGPTQRGGRN